MFTPISCKCITYGRVDLLEESLYSFLNQDYYGDNEMLIVNDYPEQKLYFSHPRVRIINCDKTFSTIGEKENFAVENCKYNTIAVWDDDDIALSNHLFNIDSFFPGYDLLHWHKGVFVNNNVIEGITGLGNSGIVYTKDIWEKAGRHALENAGYDMTFVMNLTKNLKCKIISAAPSSTEVSWMYRWGGNSYHMSGAGTDTPDRENILIRHARHIERLKNDGKIPIGDIELVPRWNVNYKELLTEYLKRN